MIHKVKSSKTKVVWAYGGGQSREGTSEADGPLKDTAADRIKRVIERDTGIMGLVDGNIGEHKLLVTTYRKGRLHKK
ncbi:hypothetical protein E2C01_063977 [Portunus trituberculatus]|uniref:Uncharacterized protein n=1 Tax=Portunus trituberculatus TaxID=210409 RepID=A0A5B7HII7_PORTR|nr:hypothetical protein [Portunus trituberculatus]